MTKKPEVYVDLDGVLADLWSRIKREFPDFEESPSHNSLTAEQWNVLFSKTPDLFADLQPMPDMKILVDYLDKKFTPDGWVILSALPNPTLGRTRLTLSGKKRWVENWLDGQPAIFCLRSQKQCYAVNGGILIDDAPENIRQWKKKGGIGILHKSAALTITELEGIPTH